MPSFQNIRDELSPKCPACGKRIQMALQSTGRGPTTFTAFHACQDRKLDVEAQGRTEKEAEAQWVREAQKAMKGARA